MIFADRVKETTSITGTGPATLLGAVTGNQTFAAAYSAKGLSTGTCKYCIDDEAGNWEVGQGTFTAPSTLTRDSVEFSSNSNALVDFVVGTKTVFLTMTSKYIDKLTHLETMQGLALDLFKARNLPSSATWTAICWNGAVFCAVASSGVNAGTSPNGIVWTSRSIGVATWTGIAWNGTVFCAIASGGAICKTSPDGITWTQRDMPVSTTWQAIAWNGSVFCAIASGGTIAATSPDGITWTQRILPASLNWKGICWGGYNFVAVPMSSTYFASSPDGINWTIRSVATSALWYDIAWNGRIFCAVANTNGNYSCTSADIGLL